MHLSLIYAFLASRILLGTSAASCNPLAVSFPFKSNILASRAEARGVSFQIGKPNAQSIALLPSASLNDTYLYGTNAFCAANISVEECTTYRGGIYNIAQSETEKFSGTIKHAFDAATANWTTDDIVLRDGTDKDVAITQFEFGVRVGPSHPYVTQGELGLGVNSTFLNTLQSGQRIASKTYSFFWGTDTAISDQPRSGSLTLGGYDQALIGDSPNTTTKFTRDEWRCREGMIVELTGLSLQSVDRGTQNILEESEKLQACVVPTLTSVLTLPAQYWDRVAQAMGVESSPFKNGTSSEMFYGAAEVKPQSATFNGNLSIMINGALTVTIPNKQLIFDEPYIASNGLVKRNPDWKNIPIVRYTDMNQNMPRLGGMFLSSAYLMVSHDKNEFTISQVQGTPAAQKLIGIDTANGCVAAVSGGATNATTGSSPGSRSSTSSRGLSGGVIAGIVVGVVAAIGVIATIAFLIWRRKRMGAAPNSVELEAMHGGGLIPEKYGYNTSEMYAGQDAGEIDGNARDHAVELDGRSRPSEVPTH